MKEILITSSALILALLALRRVFQKTLSRRWQYALWALVLARLLIPNGLFSAPAAHFSVLTATAPVQQAVNQRLDRVVITPVRPESNQTPAIPSDALQMVLDHTKPEGPLPQLDITTNIPATYHPSTATHPQSGVTAGEVLALVWVAGMVLMGAFFLLSNLAFYLKLRRGRQIWDAAPYGVKRKVYLVPDGAIPSPCLFGRSIYLTPAVADDPVKLRHVLSHESTHAKHLDPLWSLLRCVCLTIYWFDPLVWIAASCSKTDCELACDESVLCALGEQERIGYGETLLSLIPVKKGPANPMLAAITMTAGKKQLKDRITRIAQRPRQVVAAVVAVALLASVAAACTFTKGWSGEVADDPSPTVSQAPEDTALRALTGEELRWFNEEFFNSSGVDQTGEGLSTYNIRNQFANPINLYDRPESIDLYELFYCDGEAMPDEEISIVYNGDPDDLPCAAYKLTAQGMSAILEYYTGLTLDKANKESLTYTYSPEYDAYYWMHGDTNYCGELQFTVGTREGSTVKLYHNSSFAESSWYCVTLADQGDGRYWFRSNQKCEKPAIATPLPAGEPALTISLDALAPYTTHAVALEHRPESDFPGGYENRLDNWNFDGHHVMAYKTGDGLTRAALVREDGSFDVFLTTDSEQYGSMFFFHDLFGHDGFYVDHTASARNFPQRNYYYFTSDGVLTLLAEATTAFPGGAFQLDLDGDGTDELVTDNSFFFQRGGNIYQANLPALVQQADPTLSYWDWAQWSVYSKCCTATGLKDVEPYDPATWQRYFYFDGKNLLAYKDEKPTADHMVIGIDHFAPQAVVEKAKEYAQGTVEKQPDGTFLDIGWQDRPEEYRPTYDDWRVESFHGPYTYTFGDVTVKAWGFNHERHTTTPEKVVLAGGTYIDEEHWVSPGYPGCDYLFFQVEGEKYTFLWHEMNNDMGMDSKRFLEHVEQQLLNLGFDVPGAAAAQSAAAQLNRLIDRSGGLVTLRLAPADGEAVSYTAHPDRGNAPNYQRLFTDTEYYRWSFAESVSGYPEGTSLTITDPSWEYFIRLWEGSDLVMIKPDNDGAYWYQVELTATDDVFATDVFSLMRQWFDDVEAHRYDNTALGDHGDGDYQGVASAYLALYEEASKLNATPGSKYACTYVKVTDVEVLADMSERWFPADILDYPHFAFSYRVIFVPESEKVLRNFMPGNTGEYEGNDPGVPAGAFEYSRRGSMYLKDGYWHCASIGTG